MNIVILGAGTVGASIARVLCARHHNVFIIDQSRSALAEVEDRLDVHTIHGNACDPAVLFHARASTAELCLALTNSDEVNIVGASIARQMGTGRSMSRIQHPSYLDTSTINIAEHFGLASLFSLEKLTALALARAIRAHGLFALENLAQGEVEVQEVAVVEDAKAVGRQLVDLNLPSEIRVGMIASSEQSIIAGPTDIFAVGDHVTLIGHVGEIDSIRQLFEHKPPPRQHVVIAGGGETGFLLAQILEQRHRFHVTVIEHDEERCEFLANRLNSSTVLNADGTRRSQLEEARVGNADVFVAATGHDEDNIVCGVEANEMGCPRILSVVRRPDYSDVLTKVGIEKSVSPREVLAEEILSMLQSGPVISRRKISGGDAEILELAVGAGSVMTRAPLNDVPQKPGLSIAAIVRAKSIWMPGPDDQLKAGDSAIVLVESDRADEVLKLFAEQKQEPSGQDEDKQDHAG